MNAKQLVQSLGFFWLAATGLMLSTEARVWHYQDFAAPFFGVLLYLIGRNWQRFARHQHPWRLITVIGALSLLSGAFFTAILNTELHRISLISLIAGGLIALVLGIRLRHYEAG